MWRDAFRPDTFGVPPKAARSNPIAPEGRGATHNPPCRGRAWRAGLTALAAPCGTVSFRVRDRHPKGGDVPPPWRGLGRLPRTRFRRSAAQTGTRPAFKPSIVMSA